MIGSLGVVKEFASLSACPLPQLYVA